MREIDVTLPPSPDFDRLAKLIEQSIAAEGLRVASVGTLQSYAGCTHWHIKCGDESGTLEVTLWPDGRRLWFKVRAGRAAPWIDDALPRLRQRLTALFAQLSS